MMASSRPFNGVRSSFTLHSAILLGLQIFTFSAADAADACDTGNTA